MTREWLNSTDDFTRKIRVVPGAPGGHAMSFSVLRHFVLLVIAGGQKLA
jgi:hypothetical protein